MMKQTDIFNDESLQNDIQDLVAIEQAMIRKHILCQTLTRSCRR